MFSYIEITYFGDTFMKKYVGRFYITMYDVCLVQSVQTLEHTVCYFPDFFLRNAVLGVDSFFDAVLYK